MMNRSTMAAAIGALAVAGLVGMAPIVMAAPAPPGGGGSDPTGGGGTPGTPTAHPCGVAHTTTPTPSTTKATPRDHPLWLDTWRR
jgi:hypothetical protein